MSWNYRIIRSKHGEEGYWLALHEVHYNADGSIFAYAEEPIITVEEEEGVEGIANSLLMMMGDVAKSEKDIIEEADLPTVVRAVEAAPKEHKPLKNKREKRQEKGRIRAKGKE